MFGTNWCSIHTSFLGKIGKYHSFDKVAKFESFKMHADSKKFQMHEIQIHEHLSKSTNFTPFCAKWLSGPLMAVAGEV